MAIRDGTVDTARGKYSQIPRRQVRVTQGKAAELSSTKHHHGV